MYCDERTKHLVYRFGVGEMLFYVGIKHDCSFFLSKEMHLNCLSILTVCSFR